MSDYESSELRFMAGRSHSVQYYIINNQNSLDNVNLDCARALFRQECPGITYSHIMTVGIDDTVKEDDSDNGNVIDVMDSEDEFAEVVALRHSGFQADDSEDESESDFEPIPSNPTTNVIPGQLIMNQWPLNGSGGQYMVNQWVIYPEPFLSRAE